MRKENKLLILLLLLILVTSCSKAKNAAASAKDQVQQLADQASQVITPTVTGTGNNTQIILPPASKSSVVNNVQNTNILSPDYQAPCILQKFSVLNWYCSIKTLFVQQSTSLSWHIPYAFILFVLVVFFLWFIIHLWRNKN